MKRRLFAAILLAFLLSIALGSLYGRHGGAVISILAPINRSVWELTKLTFWPFLFVSILALIRLGALPAHFLAAQCSALFCMQAAVFFALLVLNQCYGLHSDAVDNAVCLTALAAGLILAYFFYRSGHTNGLLPVMGFLTAVLVICYILFTFMPPELPPFENPFTSVAGFYSV